MGASCLCAEYVDLQPPTSVSEVANRASYVGAYILNPVSPEVSVTTGGQNESVCDA